MEEAMRYSYSKYFDNIFRRGKLNPLRLPVLEIPLYLHSEAAVTQNTYITVGRAHEGVFRSYTRLQKGIS